MSPWVKAALIYVAAMTILGFVLMMVDKNRAQRNQGRRIPEASLLILAVLGASFGEFLGMKLCHHKTKHVKFYIGLPVIFLGQLILVWLLLKYL